MDPLQEQIDKFRQDYYQENGGKKSSIQFLSKRKQKLDMAQQVTAQFDINQLLNKTVYNITGTNRIVIDYTVFKLYANENIYTTLIDHLLSVYDFCIEKYGFYDVHINLATFSTTAAQRYSKMVEMFNSRFTDNSDSIYILRMNHLYIYNPPSVLEMIYSVLKHLLNPQVKTKSIIIPKSESEHKFAEIHSVI